MSKLSGKVALVTGASKGIGAGIARSLAEAGASVVVNYSSSRAGAEAVVADIVRAGGKALAVQADVARPADVQRLFATARTAFGPPDIVVNNAGIYLFNPLEAVTEEQFHRQFDTNVLGAILVIQESLNHFGPGGGSVINVSSIGSEKPFPGAVVYIATKAALDAVTRGLSVELAARKIRVNTIAPGPVDTEGLHAAGIAGSDLEGAMVAETPLGRMGQPDDVAKVVTFLASDDAAWLTGERISASGGFR
jgi:3-oxoacyl-[acyl-carrier protein] reductase